MRACSIWSSATARAAHCEAECARAGVAEHFRFTGWVPHHEVVRYMNLSDIVVMPSAAEALALSSISRHKPAAALLVASDVAGAREVVDDGMTGLLFPVGDIDGLTARDAAGRSRSRLCAGDRRPRARCRRVAHRWTSRCRNTKPSAPPWPSLGGTLTSAPRPHGAARTKR